MFLINGNFIIQMFLIKDKLKIRKFYKAPFIKLDFYFKYYINNVKI